MTTNASATWGRRFRDYEDWRPPTRKYVAVESGSSAIIRGGGSSALPNYFLSYTGFLATQYSPTSWRSDAVTLSIDMDGIRSDLDLQSRFEIDTGFSVYAVIEGNGEVPVEIEISSIIPLDTSTFENQLLPAIDFDNTVYKLGDVQNRYERDFRLELRGNVTKSAFSSTPDTVNIWEFETPARFVQASLIPQPTRVMSYTNTQLSMVADDHSLYMAANPLYNYRMNVRMETYGGSYNEHTIGGSIYDIGEYSVYQTLVENIHQTDMEGRWDFVGTGASPFISSNLFMTSTDKLHPRRIRFEIWYESPDGPIDLGLYGPWTDWYCYPPDITWASPSYTLNELIQDIRVYAPGIKGWEIQLQFLRSNFWPKLTGSDKTTWMDSAKGMHLWVKADVTHKVNGDPWTFPTDRRREFLVAAFVRVVDPATNSPEVLVEINDRSQTSDAGGGPGDESRAMGIYMYPDGWDTTRIPLENLLFAYNEEDDIPIKRAAYESRGYRPEWWIPMDTPINNPIKWPYTTISDTSKPAIIPYLVSYPSSTTFALYMQSIVPYLHNIPEPALGEPHAYVAMEIEVYNSASPGTVHVISCDNNWEDINSHPCFLGLQEVGRFDTAGNTGTWRVKKIKQVAVNYARLTSFWPYEGISYELPTDTPITITTFDNSLIANNGLRAHLDPYRYQFTTGRIIKALDQYAGGALNGTYSTTTEHPIALQTHVAARVGSLIGFVGKFTSDPIPYDDTIRDSAVLMVATFKEADTTGFNLFQHNMGEDGDDLAGPKENALRIGKTAATTITTSVRNVSTTFTNIDNYLNRALLFVVEDFEELGDNKISLKVYDLTTNTNTPVFSSLVNAAIGTPYTPVNISRLFINLDYMYALYTHTIGDVMYFKTRPALSDIETIKERLMLKYQGLPMGVQLTPTITLRADGGPKNVYWDWTEHSTQVYSWDMLDSALNQYDRTTSFFNTHIEVDVINASLAHPDYTTYGPLLFQPQNVSTGFFLSTKYAFNLSLPPAGTVLFGGTMDIYPATYPEFKQFRVIVSGTSTIDLEFYAIDSDGTPGLVAGSTISMDVSNNVLTLDGSAYNTLTVYSIWDAISQESVFYLGINNHMSSKSSLLPMNVESNYGELETFRYNDSLMLGDARIGRFNAGLPCLTWLPNQLHGYLNELLPTPQQVYELDTLMLHVDAQDDDGFTTTTFEGTTIVDTVKDLSLHVAAPHTSTWVGKQKHADPPTLATQMTLDTLNGHRSFYGVVQFGRLGVLGAYNVLPNDDYRDVMEFNTDKCYSVFQVCSFNSIGNWANAFNYMRGNSLAGFGISAFGSSNTISTSIASKMGSSATPTPLRFPESTTWSPTYSNVPVAIVARVNLISMVTDTDPMVYNYDFHLKVVNLSDAATPVLYDSVVSLPINVPVLNTNKQQIFKDYWNGGHVFLGGDELVIQNGPIGYAQPTNFKVGECLFYNSFVENSVSDSILQYLIDKWKA